LNTWLLLVGVVVVLHRAVEAVLGLEDLADGFFVGNSLRGLIAARLV
jgi:hypothetical protein